MRLRTKSGYLRCAAAALTLSTLLALPAAAQSASLRFGSSHIPALRQADTICAPFRLLCEASGYEVTWADGQAAAAGERQLVAEPGKSVLWVDGEAVRLPCAIRLDGGTTMVPVRALAKALGLSVRYDARTDTASVSSGQAAAYTEEELYWLARIVEAEAGGESDAGKLAVANVVLNRVASADYPDTVYGVIFDRKFGTQFEPTSNGTIYCTPSDESVDAARRALEGENNIGGALYFYNPSLVDAVWIRTNCTYIQTIGCHDFFL